MARQRGGKKPRRVKGCYECSQRRINCDRGSPCQKCLKKGLECSGLGIRYRFNNDVAARGVLLGKTGPFVSSSDDEISTRPEWPKKITQGKESDKDSSLFHYSCSALCAFGLDHSSYGLAQYRFDHLDHLDQQSRSLLIYFSRAIAPSMVAIDIINGYRDMVLPMAEHDETLRNAVLAASASHFSINKYNWRIHASEYRIAAIYGLRKQASGYFSEYLLHSILSTMVVLLVEELITAGQDFRVLLRMITSFVASQGGPAKFESSLVGTFLMHQIRKMSLYAAPSISQASATQSLARISTKDLGFLYSCFKDHPEYSPVITNIIGMIHKAAEIYLSRARDMPQNRIADLVESFIEAASKFNATSLGGHVLIWPFFIVGAECSSMRQREFVIHQLQCLWVCTGFRNTLYAIDLLGAIWGENSERSWTTTMVDHVKALIM